ncbi:hypothetical protein [Myroides sp. LoEW2-1]|uniref:hypothetical protein n=1 Tax=Myroides sp. LoEW2-1 TaxID=2683192 RepID=UPI001AA1232F|nr:hypothetical protein [Myroides sp. LoEW2-1]
MAAITSAAVGVAASGYSIYQGESQKKKAKSELNSYERQELINAAEQIQISTVGSDLMREETQRTTANMVAALQGGGSRAIGAGLPQLQAGINQTNRQIQKDLDDQVIQREYAIANEEANIRGIKEQRDMQNIGALQSQYAAGDQNMWNGINGAIAGIGSLSGAIGDTSKSSPQPRENQTSMANSLTPQGQTYNPFENITPPVFKPIDFTTQGNMYKGNNIV